MKSYFAYILLIVVSAGCSRDELLVDQYQPGFKANPFLTDNFCTDVEGEMLGERSAAIYTGMYILYTEDDFTTFRYNQYDQTLCSGRTVFFDGINVWKAYDESALGWMLMQIVPGNSSAREIRSHNLREGEFNSGSEPQIPTVLGADEMIFTSYSNSYPSPYEIDVYSFIDNEVRYLSSIQSASVPYRIFVSEARYFLVSKQVSSSPQTAIQSNLYVSTDAQEWDGPFVIGENTDIIQLKGNYGLTVAFNKSNQLFTSVDGGKQWTERIIPLAGMIQDIEIPEENVIYAVIANGEDEPHGPISRLVKSSDAGSTWEIMEKEFYGERISFFNSQHGIAMANGTLQVTHDGGSTWKLVLVGRN
jgi:hypothetical protein